MELDILNECKNAGRIGISGHVRPDGDCTGACLGLWQYLRKCLPEADVKVYLEKPADIFAQIMGFQEIVTDFPDEPPFDPEEALDEGLPRRKRSILTIMSATWAAAM